MESSSAKRSTTPRRGPTRSVDPSGAKASVAASIVQASPYLQDGDIADR